MWVRCKNIATLESSKGRAIRIMAMDKGREDDMTKPAS
jgi:hypothetical protein